MIGWRRRLHRRGPLPPLQRLRPLTRRDNFFNAEDAESAEERRGRKPEKALHFCRGPCAKSSVDPSLSGDMTRNQISEAIIGAAIEVHRALGPGLVEKAYEEALCHELHLAG